MVDDIRRRELLPRPQTQLWTVSILHCKHIPYCSTRKPSNLSTVHGRKVRHIGRTTARNTSSRDHCPLLSRAHPSQHRLCRKPPSTSLTPFYLASNCVLQNVSAPDAYRSFPTAGKTTYIPSFLFLYKICRYLHSRQLTLSSLLGSRGFLRITTLLSQFRQ